MKNPGPVDPRFAFRTPAQQFNPRARAIAFQAGNFPDQRQLEFVGRQAQSVPQVADVIDSLNARNLPPQLNQVPFIVSVTANDTPTLILPKNVRRQSWLLALSDFTHEWQWSYDFPMSVQSTGIPFCGFPQLAPAIFGEANGSISINDIYAWVHGALAGDFPLFFYGSEGSLSVSGNRP
jgi:hypothetical protein